MSEIKFGGGQDLITMEQCRLERITDSYIQACAANRSFYELKHVYHLPRAFPLSDEAVYASLKNDGYASQMLGFLLYSKPGLGVEVSENTSIQAISHRTSPIDLVRRLADHWGTLPVTKQSMLAAVKNTIHSKEIVDYLLQHTASGTTMLNDDVLVAAIMGKNLGFIQYFMLRKPDFEIKGEHLEAAINLHSFNILRFLLSQKRKLPITDPLLETAARRGNRTILELLMDQEHASQPPPQLFELLKA